MRLERRWQVSGYIENAKLKADSRGPYWVDISENDIVVTTPKLESEKSAEEAQRCIQAGGGFYFRRFIRKPKRLGPGSKIFYVEEGFIRGFGLVCALNYDSQMISDVTLREWGEGYYALMPAHTWRWIEPIRCKAFQGFRYMENLFASAALQIQRVKVIGGWLDPKPELKNENSKRSKDAQAGLC